MITHPFFSFLGYPIGLLYKVENKTLYSVVYILNME